MNIKILVDSGSDIPKELAEKYQIGVVPLTITFEKESVKDYYGITNAQFYERLASEKELPKTSQPNPHEFEEEFRKHPEADAILCIAISSHVSGTYSSALMAEKNLAAAGNFKPEIHVFDSGNVSLPVTMLAEKAAEMAENGSTVTEIIKVLSSLRDKTISFFVPDSLTYLQKGGRVGAVSAMLGGLFHFKAFITVIDGMGKNIGKVRGQNAVIPRLLELYSEKAAELNGRIFISHGDCKKRAEELMSSILKLAPKAKITLAEMGCTIGTHAGPGTLAIAFEGLKKITV